MTIVRICRKEINCRKTSKRWSDRFHRGFWWYRGSRWWTKSGRLHRHPLEQAATRGVPVHGQNILGLITARLEEAEQSEWRRYHSARRLVQPSNFADQWNVGLQFSKFSRTSATCKSLEHSTRNAHTWAHLTILCFIACPVTDTLDQQLTVSHFFHVFYKFF